MSLTADPHTYEDDETALEDYFERGWTDGLPIVPPTLVRVGSMLEAGGIDPDEVLGAVPTRDVVVTAEKVAINAVMAGCRDEYFPLVLAAVRAHLQPLGNSHSTTATLGGAAQAVIVNGPVRNQIDLHSGQACFGPGFRANATIGRAVRLVIRNVCRSVPGVLDRATWSTPLRYSFCFGENEEASDWTPLHVQRGYSPEESTVTVCSVQWLVHVNDYASEPIEILEAMAHVARQTGLKRDQFCGDGRCMVLAMGPEHQRRFIDQGWTKEQVQEELWPLLVAETADKYDKKLVLASPENVVVVPAGGPGVTVSWWLFPHLSNPITEMVRPC
jgi:hypothetical protein